MSAKGIRKKKVSQKDVAHAAGVSQPVVSAALNGSSSVGVSEATLKRVRLIAEDMGYEVRRNPVALGGSKTVVLIQNSREIASSSEWMPFSYTLFYMRYVDGLLAALQGSGYHLAIKSPDPRKDFAKELDALAPEALIWKGGSGVSREMLLDLNKRYPVIGINAAAPPGINTVDVDQERVVSIACEHLVGLGHRRIAYVGGDKGHARIRRRSLEQYAEDNDLLPPHPFVVEAEPGRPKGQIILDEWERLGEGRPTALLMADFYALKVMEEAARRGVRIPDDLSLVGIDNTPDCEACRPRLSSVEQPLEAVCKSAVNMVIDPQKTGPGHCSSIRLEPSIVVRDSCGSLSRPGEG